MGLSKKVHIAKTLSEYTALLNQEMAWGAKPTELRHLVGRLGELYIAEKYNGSMAVGVNEKGFDVISSRDNKISVKTFCLVDEKTSREDYAFPLATEDNKLDKLADMDELSIVQIEIVKNKVKSIKEYFNGINQVIIWNSNFHRDKVKFRIKNKNKLKEPPEGIEIKNWGVWKEYKILEDSNGKIYTFEKNELKKPTKDYLIEIVKKLKKEKNILIPVEAQKRKTKRHTRSLGKEVIKALNEL